MGKKVLVLSATKVTSAVAQLCSRHMKWEKQYRQRI